MANSVSWPSVSGRGAVEIGSSQSMAHPTSVGQQEHTKDGQSGPKAVAETGTRKILEEEEVDISQIPNAVHGEHYINYRLAPGEYLLQCPYDISHRILPMRMGNHMYRCRRNHEKKLREEGLSPRLIVCQWNPAHLVLEMEFEYHANQCQDRHKTKEELRSHLKSAPKNLIHHKELELTEEEDWGNEPVKYGSYNPKIKLEREMIIYQPKMLTKSEKKEWREKQRWKWYYLANGQGVWADYRNERLDRLHQMGLGPSEWRDSSVARVNTNFGPMLRGNPHHNEPDQIAVILDNNDFEGFTNLVI